MRDIDFVITGVPRSGTLYTKRLLTLLGIKTGHEDYFCYDKAITQDEEDEPFGDVAWCAAPYLQDLPSSTVILRQTRDPIKVLDSIRGHANPSLLTNDIEVRDEHRQFVYNNCRTVFRLYRCENVRTIKFYYWWTEKIKKYEHYSYDVSALQNPYFVYWLVDTIVGKKLPIPVIQKALDRLSTTTHSSSNRNVPWAEDYLAINRNKKYWRYLR